MSSTHARARHRRWAGYSRRCARWIAAADHLLRWGKVNRVVHVDNWLLSTNLHGDWTDDLPAIRTFPASSFPPMIADPLYRQLVPPALLDAAR